MGQLQALFKSAAEDVFQRAVHVPREELVPIGNYYYQPVVIGVQRHDALRRGTHYDLRIGLPDRSISFVIPSEQLPATPGQTSHWIHQPDHVPEYATLSGEIPRGQYGAGKFKLVKKYQGVLHTNADGSQDLYFRNDDGQDVKVTLNQRGQDNKMYFAVARTLPTQRHWAERKAYKTIKLDGSLKGHMASEKLDGAMMYAVLTDKGITLTSRRKGKNGQLLVREHHVPWIRDVKIPREYQGLVLAGELVHPRGFSVLSGILNSHPVNAIIRQQTEGRTQFVPWDVLSLKGVPYRERAAVLDDIVGRLGNPYIKALRRSDDPEALLKQIEAEGGEGVILARPQGLEDEPLYRVKLWHPYVGEIVGYEPGKGKLTNMVGAILVKDANGRTVRVGSGKGLDDNLRAYMAANWDEFMGKKIRVLARESTNASLRHPLFGGFELDETPLDAWGR